MAGLRPDYVQLADLKAHLRITDTNDDAALALCITTASRAVDQFCDRPFGLTGSAVQRLFTWHGEMIDGCVAVPIDDLMTTVGLVVTVDSGLDYSYATTIVNGTDFDFYPPNAVADGVPFTHLVLRTGVTTTWTCPGERRNAYSVTGNWGWSAIPSAVEIATLITAAAEFVRRDSPYGVTGSPDMGSELRIKSDVDPTVKNVLGAYKRWWGAAG